MSDSVRPHRRQPTRLCQPRDSPGKNTGVGCHFLLQCMKVKSESEVAQSCESLRPHGLQPTRLLCPWDFPGKSTGVGCLCLLLWPPLILPKCERWFSYIILQRRKGRKHLYFVYIGVLVEMWFLIFSCHWNALVQALWHVFWSMTIIHVFNSWISVASINFQRTISYPRMPYCQLRSLNN